MPEPLQCQGQLPVVRGDFAEEPRATQMLGTVAVRMPVRMIAAGQPAIRAAQFAQGEVQRESCPQGIEHRQ